MLIITFLAFLGGCIAASVGGILNRPGDWYVSLNKPQWTPPNWLFPLAWALLYLMLALAATRVAMIEHALAITALAFWSFQLALNAIWSPVFFGLQRVKAGFLILTGLWGATLVTTFLFLDVDIFAGLLMMPYLAWVSFALLLNGAVLRLNPTV